jgi:hypothetical protein
VTEDTLDSQEILSFTTVVSNLFNDDVSSPDYITSNDGMIELEGMWKEAFVE